jgi:hypothetical protein
MALPRLVSTWRTRTGMLLCAAAISPEAQIPRPCLPAFVSSAQQSPTVLRSPMVHDHTSTCLCWDLRDTPALFTYVNMVHMCRLYHKSISRSTFRLRLLLFFGSVTL